MAITDARVFPLKNAAYRVTFPILDADGDLVTGATALDSEFSIDGGTFADCLNEATEIAIASGMYFLDLTAAEMNGDTVAVIVKTTTVGAKTTSIVMYPEETGDINVDVTSMSAGVITAAVIASDAITDAKVASDVTINSVTGSVGAVTAAVTVGTNNDKTGYALAADIRIKKNTLLNNFLFAMVDSVDHVTPKTGLIVTTQRSLDGAAFANSANSAVEVSSGLYRIDLAASDLNADVVALKFTATGADARIVTIVTQID